MFGIKVVNFLCSGREGFQLCTLLGKFFRVVAVQRNDLEVPGVAVAAHGARGSPGRVMLLVVSILFLLFIVRSDFSAIFVSILGVHLLHRFFFGIMFECSVLWARLWFHSFLFHICYIFVKDFKILQVTTLFCLLCMEGVEKGREGSSFGDV